VSTCECEWPGECTCQPQHFPVTTPAKACKIRLKTAKGRDTLAKESVTASEPTHIKEKTL
jgi:hypothetical protein